MKQPYLFTTFLVLVIVDFALAPAVRGEVIIFFEENGGAEKPRGLYNFDTDTGSSELRCLCRQQLATINRCGAGTSERGLTDCRPCTLVIEDG